jgi:hypothetical protein
MSATKDMTHVCPGQGCRFAGCENQGSHYDDDEGMERFVRDLERSKAAQAPRWDVPSAANAPVESLDGWQDAQRDADARDNERVRQSLQAPALTPRIGGHHAPVCATCLNLPVACNQCERGRETIRLSTPCATCGPIGRPGWVLMENLCPAWEPCPACGTGRGGR